MGILKKSLPSEPTTRRRHPKTDTGPRGTQAFSYSYHDKRFDPAANTGRTPIADRQAVHNTHGTTSADNTDSLPRTLRQRLVLYASATVVAAVSLYSMVLHTTPQVVADTNGGSAYFMQDINTYQQTAAKSLEGTLLSRSKLTVDTAKVSSELMNNYPEIRTATVSLPLIGQTPLIRIMPYQPAFILTTTNSAAFLLDENGRALVSASQITDVGELDVPTVQDRSGLEVRLGQQALPMPVVSFVTDIVRVLDAAGIKYSDLVLPAAASEMDVVITGTPYFVKFNLQGDARQQAGTFIATKKRLANDKITPGQYVDVRVPERAYYK